MVKKIWLKWKEIYLWSRFFLFNINCLLISFFFIKHSQDSNIYDENIPTEIKGDSSERWLVQPLIGASRANTTQIPFVVGFSLAEGETDRTSCTGGYQHILMCQKS